MARHRTKDLYLMAQFGFSKDKSCIKQGRLKVPSTLP